MKAAIEIFVFEELGNFLNTREAATELLQVARNNACQIVEVNFDKVEFMSRSFADQFHKEQLNLQKQGINLQIVNANEEIINILRIVSQTQNKPNREFNKIPVYKFSKPELLSEYLLSI